MSMMKDPRLLTVIALIAISLYLVGSPLLASPSGTVVVLKEEQSRCTTIQVGDRINQINSQVIANSQDFVNALRFIKEGDSVTMVVNGLPNSCIAVGDRSIGVIVEDVKREGGIKFGIDIDGGTRAILEPEATAAPEEIDDAIRTLNTRINFYGLSDVKVTKLGDDFIQIEIAESNSDVIRDFLSKQGVFEGKILESIRITNGTGEIIFNGNKHPITSAGSSMLFNGTQYTVNNSFLIDGVRFEVLNITSSQTVLAVNVFDGEDIEAVFTDAQNSRVFKSGDVYEFLFTVRISEEGADRFAKITKGQPIVFSGTERYIEPKLALYLDSTLISQLNIVSSLAGQSLVTASIQGSEPTREEALQEKVRLESTLRSGSLPIKLEIVKVDTITQTAGRGLLESTLFVVVAAAIAVSSMIVIRYRNVKIALPMIVLSLSEIVIVLGMATSQAMAVAVILAALAIGIIKKEITGLVGWLTVIVMIGASATIAIAPWTIDVAAIAGLIAIIGTGVNQMIIMTDQLVNEKDRPLSERRRVASGMIWNSAAIVTFAMLPLIVMGIGTLRGFAIATIVGVLVGVLLTRPAYVAILERVKKLHLE